MTIDNGGPPLEIDAKLRWVKVNITEILEGIEELSWEQRGYYLTALFKMYARMGGLPADKYEGAKAMRCDVRFFQRLRDQIVATGKFYVEDGLLKNSRVEREIAEYVREHKKRRDAALEREQRRREAEAGAQANAELHSTSGRLPGDFRETSGRSPGEVSDTSSRLEAENSTKSNDAPPQHYHKRTTNQNQEPEPEERKRSILSETSSDDGDATQSSGKARRSYPEAFEQFWRQYPDTRNNSKLRAFNEWRKLDATDRELALKACAGYARYCLENKEYRCLHAERFISHRRFEGYAVASQSPGGSASASVIWWQDPAKVAAITDAQWRGSIAKHANGVWPPDKLGPAPGSKRCVVPQRIIDELKLTEKYDANGISKIPH